MANIILALQIVNSREYFNWTCNVLTGMRRFLGKVFTAGWRMWKGENAGRVPQMWQGLRLVGAMAKRLRVD